jgi:hypothetical protein
MSSRTADRQFMKSLDELSVASTNLSLFSIASTKRSLPLFKTYGKFNYFSYYEKFMNMRSKHRIPRHLMPELVFELLLIEFFVDDLIYFSIINRHPTEEEVADLTQEDLFSPNDLKALDKLYDVYKARPFRLRSKSVNSSNSIEHHEKNLKMTKNNLTRLASIECFDSEYIDNKFQISKKYELSHKKIETSDEEYRKNLLATFETEYDNMYPKFYARDIKCPKVSAVIL